ncbi:DUF1819 family protein [Agrobacterium pusense]|uniref:DUF1819 family protein n=1 Tax=Agrobacterium pusense TaxID=648995 RepID=UPI00289D45D9|nr:DUF1819 family protein [Agrobacterium pusense]
MAFSTGGLFVNECIAITAIFQEADSWNGATDLARERNIFGFRKEASAVRTTREVVKRLRKLSTRELELLLDGERLEQAAIVWLAVCRTYGFIREFASELLFERYLSGRLLITHDDFDVFLDRKAEWYPELEKLTSSTSGKLRQVLFRMMREASIATPDNHIIPANLTPRLESLIVMGDPTELRLFPGARLKTA